MRNNGKANDPVLVVALGPKLLGLDTSTGAVIFEHKLSTHTTARIRVHDDRIIVQHRLILSIFRYPDGAVISQWKLPFKGWTHAGTLLIRGRRAFLACGGEVAAVSIDDGMLLWHQPLPRRGVYNAALGLPGLEEQADLIGSN